MANLFVSRSFHCFWLPLPNLPPKPSERLRLSAPISFPRQWSTINSSHHIHILPNSISSSSSVPEDDEDIHIISSTQCSDGSFVFKFGNASEIRENIGELDQNKLVREVPEEVEEGGFRAVLKEGVDKLRNEDDHKIGEEIESSSIVIVGIADQNSQLLVTEEESTVLDSGLVSPVINDSQKNDRLDSVKDGDGQHGILDEAVATESVSEEDSQNDSHKEVVVSTVSPDSDVLSDLSNGASGYQEVEEKEVDKGNGVDRAVAVDADPSELVPLSTSLDTEHSVHRAPNNLTGSADVETSELVRVSNTPLETEQVDIGTTDNPTGSADAETSELVQVSTYLESEQVDNGTTENLTGSVDPEISELVPVSTSLESEQVDNSATDNLTGSSDPDISEFVPVSTCLETEISELVPVSTLESEPVDNCTTNNLTGSADADISELAPVSTSLESTEVDCSTADNPTESVDAEISESVPVSTLESEQVDNCTTDNLTDSVGANISELVPVSTPSEFEQVDNRATEDLTGNADADISELVPVSTLLESEQSANGATGNLTAGDAELTVLVPVSTPLKAEQVDNSAINGLTGRVDADSTDSAAPISTPFESELHDEETTHHIVDGSVDASKIEKSATLQDLVPSSDLENKIDVGNTKISDYEYPTHITIPESDSVEMAGHGGKTSRTELFLVSGAACFAHPSKALTVREDAYFISRQHWLAVADGVGQWSLEGSNTGLYIRELMENCENIVSNCENISTIKPAVVLTRSVTETQTPGSSSILVAHFDGQTLHAANVGNTGFLIIRDGSIFKKSNAMFHEFSFPLHIVKDDDHSDIIEEYKIDLNNGDVIVFATNGLFDNLYEQEIASTVSKLLQANLRPQEIAEFLAIRAQEVGRSTTTRSPFGDAAQAVGYVGYAGGKLDDVTVVVSLVQTR